MISKKIIFPSVVVRGHLHGEQLDDLIGVEWLLTTVRCAGANQAHFAEINETDEAVAASV